MFPIKYIDNNLVWNKDNEVFANDSKSISTNTTNYTEMTVIFYSVTFQSSMTILSMRLLNENC